ncbi:hypothetical protein BGZ98_005337 [Dissophora globulifera]|nr:hypothetical protein BGZ98_005337 [Dissophora globulifera]
MSISDIETGLPPLRGEDACYTDYIQWRELVKGQPDMLYNGDNRFKRHKWDARRAKEAEYRLITDRLLKLVGGSVGTRRDESNKARSQGYIVLGVNEYYTSKKCPKCEEFVAQVEIRRLYCLKCKSFIHRDIMAAHNICNVVKEYLMEQRRPKYLQPVDAQGGFPWQETQKRLAIDETRRPKRHKAGDENEPN